MSAEHTVTYTPSGVVSTVNRMKCGTTAPAQFVCPDGASENTLETSGEVVQLHSKRVGKM
jgi:hypothetical protein